MLSFGRYYATHINESFAKRRYDSKLPCPHLERVLIGVHHEFQRISSEVYDESMLSKEVATKDEIEQQMIYH